LIVVTHVPHKLIDGGLVSLSPEVCELDCLGSLFEEVAILAPLADEAHRSLYPESRYEHPSVELLPTPFQGSERLRQMLPSLPRFLRLFRHATGEASAVHLRCPSNPSLVCMIALALGRRQAFVKYRGAWGGFGGEPIVWRLQRFLLRRLSARWLVGTYAPHGARRPGGAVPMFATTLREADIERAGDSARHREAGTNLLTACVLGKGKNVDILIRGLALLPPEFTLRIAGDGEERASLEELTRSLGVGERVRFLGLIAWPQLAGELRKANVFLLASRTEGFPKSCVEAMAHGLPCVVGKVNRQTGIADERGFYFDPADPGDLRERILRLVEDPATYRAFSRNARCFSEDKTLERLKRLYEENLMRHGMIERAD